MNAIHYESDKSIENAVIPKNNDDWIKIIESVVSRKDNIKLGFIKKIKENIEKNQDREKLSIYIGQQAVRGNDDYEVDMLRFYLVEEVMEDLKSKGLITEIKISTKWKHDQLEKSIYIDFLVTSKNILKKIDLQISNLKKNIKRRENNIKDKNITKYNISFRNGKIILNDKYLLSEPDFDSTNYNLFEYAFMNPNRKILKEETKIELPSKTALRNIIFDLGFKGELKEMFFPMVTKKSFQFNNPISKEDFKEMKINIDRLNSQIKDLKPFL